MSNDAADHSSPASTVWSDYVPLPDVYDEMVRTDGSLRPHWQAFIDGLDRISGPVLAERWAAAERLLHENGLTYTVVAEMNEGLLRPWELDVVPLIVDAGEWRDLSAGLVQRARLLNAILADLYGPQRLLHEGRLPPAVVFANPHFIRQCHGIRPRDDVFLHEYAADLGRGPDGRWHVLADRCQTPSGIGYALENRIILSHCLGDLFRDCQVERLAGYFQASHDFLLARTGRDDPRIVLLSPGPGVEGYFAQAYLARYLGYSLAEGGDLTVRGARVFLKSVDGLKPVDLILRRVDSEACDPLELRSDSEVGIAGLLQAARARSVVVANTIGSGLAETKALAPFLPDLCRALLGEDLALSGPQTWWCGDRTSLEFVFSRFDDLVVEHAFRRRPLLSATTAPTTGAALADFEREALIEDLGDRGFDYVAHEPIHLSTTPSWSDGRLRPRLMTLRVFLSAAEDGFNVMPGGLTRVTASNDARAAALTRGQGTKDTWVLADGPVAPLTLLRSPLSYIQPKRTGKDLPSRAADNLFWLGRYAERAENLVRGLRVVVRLRYEDVGPTDGSTAVHLVLQTLSRLEEPLGPVEAPAAGRTAPASEIEGMLHGLLFDPKASYGLPETVSHLHRTASLIRDRLSLDTWRVLHQLHNNIREFLQQSEWLAGFHDWRDCVDVLDNAVRTLAAFNGLEMENMTRNLGWRFLDMGRRLERAYYLSKLLRNLLVRGRPEDDGRLVLLLELADSIITYRSRYLTTPILPPVIDLLLLDETNPRSAAFQIAALSEHVNVLPRDDDAADRSEAQKIILSLLTQLRLAEIPALCGRDDTAGRRVSLEALLRQIEDGLPKLSELIGRDYFSHAYSRPAADL
jgi:uncharacterized circularly permuted ATP-grasp superfamily protein/uncharacterized alpha-E superfamily protein